MSSGSKWNDDAVKDLAFAVIMASSATAPDWSVVTTSMNAMGYNFTKSAINQHWSKKVWKEFRERHSKLTGGDNDVAAQAAATPKKAKANGKKPKTPVSGKKRPSTEDDDEDELGGYISSPIAQSRTPRSNKKVKYNVKEDVGHDSDEEAEVQGVEDTLGKKNEAFDICV